MKQKRGRILMACLLACLLLPWGAAAQKETDAQAQLERIFGILEARLGSPATYEDYDRLATMAYARGEYEKALDYLGLCIELAGEGNPLALATLWTEKGTVYRKLGRAEEASEALETASGYAPSHPLMLWQKAGLAMEAEDYATAAGLLETYVALLPEDAEAWKLLAKAYQGKGDRDPLREAQDQAAALARDKGNAQLTAARRQALLGDPAAAERGYTGYLTDHGDATGEVYFQRGVARIQQGNAAGAIGDLEAALALHYPEQATCYAYLSSCYFLLNNHQKVLETGARALELGGKAQEGGALYQRMGIAALSLGDAAQAETYFTKAQRTHADLLGTLYYRALARMTQGKFRAAVKDLDESIDRGELVQQCLYNRGLCRVQLEETPEAVADFEAAMSMTDDPAISEAASDMLWQIASSYLE